MKRVVSRRRDRGKRMWLARIASVAVGLVGVVVLALGVSAGSGPVSVPEGEPVTAATVVVTAGGVNQTDMTIAGEVEADLRKVAEQNGVIEQIKVDGDGRTVRRLVDMTPRQTSGTELKVLARRVGAISDHLAAMQEEYNAFDSFAPGRSVLAGLQAVEEEGRGPVVLFSPLPDLNNPLDHRQLAWDVDPAAVVAQIDAAGDLPHHLTGREVLFVVTPAAGKQKPFRQPQTDYVRKVLTVLVKKAGGSATFVTGEGGQPQGTGGDVPTVAVPDAAGTLRPDKRQERQSNGTTTEVATCTLPAPMLFAPDRATLLDPSGAKRALRTCLKGTDETTRIGVDGHTARTGPGGVPHVAKALSTDRARAVAHLLEDLGVDADRIARIKGWGSTKPIVKPAGDPGNRAVVVRMTTIRTKGSNR